MNAKDPAPAPMERAEDRRRRKARQTREALAAAAVGLVLERGLGAVTVEAIADRADVTRRTFSRHFGGKEDAALDFTRTGAHRINEALRARPSSEPPLLAYRRAVEQWLTEPSAPHRRPHMRELLAALDTEPALFAAYERLRVDAQEESVRIIADRLGTDRDRDIRPAVVVGAAAGVLTAALRHWARAGAGHGTDLADLVGQAYDALTGEAAHEAAPHTATRE
ncbi:TetR/AcrR family transcriptional regulator [Streptomyces sp. NPDC058067]|uniref:TetR/AcrR family transcriptional regulator n=1 Tax=Streptomyces sp. NPDC058067 TaxID=3346324 RepID=UPI0036E17157